MRSNHVGVQRGSDTKVTRRFEISDFTIWDFGFENRTQASLWLTRNDRELAFPIDLVIFLDHLILSGSCQVFWAGPCQKVFEPCNFPEVCFFGTDAVVKPTAGQ